MLSTFLLPKSYSERVSLYQKLLTSKKSMYFIIDGLTIKNKKDVDKIENFMIFNSEHFTDTKIKLNEHENYFTKKYKNISLV